MLIVCELIMQVDVQSPWWVEALHSVAARRLENELGQRIKDELSSTDMDLGSIGRYVTDQCYTRGFN